MSDDRGYPTPVEQFIHCLMRDYRRGDLDRDTITMRLADLDSAIQDMKDDLEIQARLYPDFMEAALKMAKPHGVTKAVA